MNLKITYAIIGFLIVIIGGQAYHQFVLNERIAKLEARTQPLTHAANSQTPQAPSFNSDPFDSFFDDHLGPQTDPADTIQRMRERMNRLFDSSFGTYPFDLDDPFGGSLSSRSPNIDIKEEKERYIIHVSPIDPQAQDVEVNAQDQQLTLTFKTKAITEEKNHLDQGSISRYSSSSQQFTRSLTLDEPIVPASMETDFHDDVLEITILKKV